MAQRLNPDDYVAAEVKVYEAHFTNDELLELIAGQKDANAGKQPTISQHLKDKLTESAVTIQSEILGAFAQIGAKVGGQIGLELGKEHPEWEPKAQPAASKSQ